MTIPNADIQKVIDALPSEYEPSRCHISDLMVRTRLPCETLEAVLRHLGERCLIMVDKCDADPFHPSDAQYFGAQRVFTLRGR
jgi:hypothetical protein